MEYRDSKHLQIENVQMKKFSQWPASVSTEQLNMIECLRTDSIGSSSLSSKLETGYFVLSDKLIEDRQSVVNRTWK